MKRVLLCAIALCLLSTSFVVAAGRSDSAAAGAGVTLTAYTADFGISPIGTLVHQTWLEEAKQYLGVDLTINFTVIPWGQYGERINITLASGDFPDIFTVTNRDHIVEYGDQGMFVDLVEYDELTPNYLAYVRGTPAYQRSVYTPEGKLYAFYDGYVGQGQGTQWNWAYRFDAFQEHDVAIPTTLDEYLEAARRLKQIYPDSFPVGQFIGNNASWYSVQRPFLAVNHTDYSHYWNGSEWVYGPMEESYREALQFVHQLYAEGLLDPEFTTITSDQRDSRALSGKNFMFPNFFGANVYRYNSNTESDAVWGISVPPSNPSVGSPWMISANPDGKLLRPGFGIVIDANSRHIETAIRLVDHFYTDEMLELMNWGIEGQTFRRNADGTKEFLPRFMDTDNPTERLAELGVSSTMRSRSGIIFTPQDFAAQVALMKPHPFYADGRYMDGLYWVDTYRYGQDMIRPSELGAGMAGLSYSQAEREFRQINLDPIQTYVDESAIKFITGEMSLATGWDAYLAEIRRLGNIDGVTAQMNAKM